MKTAIITGASSGLGREFARQLTDIFPEIECCWLIARREDRLEEIAREMVGVETVCLPLDLCDSMSFTTLQEKLAAVKPEVAILINNAGCGYLGRMGETETAVQTRMVDLNVRAMTAMTNLVIPYMPAGGRILNTSSIASFCPTPRMTVYGASKAYVSSFTVGLSEELKRRDITVTAVCPGPMKTEFLDVGSITGRSPAFEYLPYCDQVRVAAGALRAAKAGRTVHAAAVLQILPAAGQGHAGEADGKIYQNLKCHGIVTHSDSGMCYNLHWYPARYPRKAPGMEMRIAGSHHKPAKRL